MKYARKQFSCWRGWRWERSGNVEKQYSEELAKASKTETRELKRDWEVRRTHRATPGCVCHHTRAWQRAGEHPWVPPVPELSTGHSFGHMELRWRSKARRTRCC